MRKLAVVLMMAVAGTGAWSAPAAAVQQAGGAEAEHAFVALVTGSTGGLGRELARRLAADGAHVIVHGRNQERGDELVAEIAAAGKGSARFIAADLASFAEVRQLAATILEDYDRLDLLINNAGIWLEDEDGRQVSDDGHELTFQVNYLSGFLLTHMLLPLVKESAPARIIQVSSVAQRPVDFSNVMLEQNYSAGAAYGQSKLAQILFTVDLATELQGTGVLTAAVHPASMMNTDMVLERGARARSTVEEGTEAVMNAVRTPELESGTYFQGLQARQANAQAYDAEARARLRALSVELTGVGGG
jgi:NAD(P)-dependent dehydrogenase (short-subunit alcohol dehydrogenase family)